MIEVAREVRIESPMAPEPLTTWEDGPLELDSNIPVNVYVKIDLDKKVVGLALSSTGTYFTGGILWGCSGYSLMITFVFMYSPDYTITEVTPITPSFWFSDTFPPDEDNQQSCCVPSIPGEYHFNVNYKGLLQGHPENGKIDPIIVVTPL
jgi:hypothetical protein